jgi:hypothetical protein
VSRLGLIFERQWLHLASLVLLFLGMKWVSGTGSLDGGSLAGVGSRDWALLAVGLAVAHQVLVWFCWRTELHAGLLSRLPGETGFTLYAILFAILGVTRTIAVWCLAIANQGTLDLAGFVRRPLAIALLLPALYLFYSVKRYFGFRRALGADHFDPAYRTMPRVREGIFRFTSNGMYTYGFLVLWVPAIWWGSTAALWVALFNHLYIWVHFFSTESPDMRRIYGGQTGTP